MTPAQARRQRRELLRDIARDQKRQQKEHLSALRQAIKDARAARKAAILHAKHGCRRARAEARQRASELRARVLAELRETLRLERQAARGTCATGLAAAREIKDRLERSRAELAAERQYRREMRQIEKSSRARRTELVRSSVRERGLESDEEVAGNIPPELTRLWERVKRRIRGSDRMTRTEAFLHYAEEHPSEVLLALEDRTEEVIRELEKQEKQARRALARPAAREEREEAPF